MYYDFIPESGSYLWGKGQGLLSEKYPRIDKVCGMSAESPKGSMSFENVTVRNEVFRWGIGCARWE